MNERYMLAYLNIQWCCRCKVLLKSKYFLEILCKKEKDKNRIYLNLEEEHKI